MLSTGWDIAEMWLGKDQKYFSQIWNTVLVKITDSIEMYSSS